MTEIVLVAGYTYRKNILKLQNYFKAKNVAICCAYTRQPHTDIKKKYLDMFDMVYDLTQQTAKEALLKQASAVSLVTCTQERDMDIYIDTLELVGHITDTQASLYKKMVHKQYFKEELRATHPSLVPEHQVLNMENLDTLTALTYPQVIKPTGLAGSSFVQISNSAEEARAFLETHHDDMTHNGGEFYERSMNIIAEEFVAGPQYSVNAYVDANGKVILCPIMRVIPAYEIDNHDDTYSAIQYTTEELASPLYSALETAIQTIATTFQLKKITAHFDAVLHNGSWKFFEASIRPGGKRDDVYELSHGMDHFLNDIRNKIGKTLDLGTNNKTVAIVQKGTDKVGALAQIAYTRAVTEEKSPLIQEKKMAKLGQLVMPVSHGGGTITRHYVVGKDEAAVIKTATALRDAITFTIVKINANQASA